MKHIENAKENGSWPPQFLPWSNLANGDRKQDVDKTIFVTKEIIEYFSSINRW